MSSVQQIAAEFTTVPCSNDDRLPAAVALFEKLGAKRQEISVEDLGVAKNVVVTVPGTSAHASTERIVIVAHFDQVAAGCGAFDNWTGMVAIAHMYGTVKNLQPSKTMVFVGFGEEEKGLVGSKAMADQIASDRAAEYCAMINIDSLGNAMPQAFSNMSSQTLVDSAARAAQVVNVPFARVESPVAFADSLPFMSKGIPAITVVGMTSEWPKILHSMNDTADKIEPQSVHAGYRVALSLLAVTDRAPCHAFR
jgi:Zn-dependent M28 family amino/carboxypeptidase